MSVLMENIPVNKYSYGPYNCTMNATVLYLLKQGLNVDPIYHYNFNINCQFADKTISGSMPNDRLFTFVKENYHYEMIEHHHRDLPSNEFIITRVDVYYIPGNIYYQKYHSGHNMLVQIMDNHMVNINDPYLNIYTELPYEIFVKALMPNIPAYSFNKLSEIPQINEVQKPYIMEFNYKELYQAAEGEISLILKSVSENLTNEYDVDGCFGKLRTAEIARENYFKSAKAPTEYATKIMAGWKRVMMNFARMKNNAKYLDDMMLSVQNVFTSEIAYLDTLNNRK